MKISRYIFFATIIITFLTACHSRKNGTPQEHETQNSNQQEVKNTQDENSLQINFTMNDIEGKTISVKDEFTKHTITVIDFWASWCGPCRQEMPNLVKTYKKYKDKGLGIIGVSLDEDGEQWKNAIKEMNMSWLQLSDLQGWDNSAAQMYGIQSIPFTIIVDNNGSVINAGLRGIDLENFIHNYLNDPLIPQHILLEINLKY